MRASRAFSLFLLKFSDNYFMKKFFLCCAVFLCVFQAFCDYYKTNVVASYYADDFHGKKTSNGEIFNMYALTCAHKVLPFGTVVKVTNQKNGKSVHVRVNDRGPFVKTREMDLSKAAAVKLGMIKSGTARVNLEIVSLGKSTKASVQTAVKACKIAGIPYNSNFSNSIKSSKSGSSSAVASKSKSAVSATASKNGSVSSSKTGTVATSKNNASANAGIKSGRTSTKYVSSSKSVGQSKFSSVSSSKTGKSSSGENSLWDIQVGAFSSKTNANNLAQKLLKDGFKDVVFQKQKDGGDVIRVVIRKVSSDNLDSVEKSLAAKGYSGYVVKKRSLKP